MSYILQTNHLTKIIDGKELVTDVNIHVKKGEIYGFLGPNGAGKTTVMKMITNLWKPTKGTVELFGKTLETTSYEVLKRMGSIIEFPTFYEHMSGKDNLQLHCEYMGYYNKGSIDEVLEMLNLREAANKPVKSYSLGMKQRLGLGIAMVGNPDILILDEPINGLDPEGIIEIRELILKLNKEKGITFIISSHYLDELSKIATYYGFIDSCRIIKEISKEDLDQNFRKRIQINITNLKESVKYLEEKNIPYKVISDNIIDIYEKINISNLVIELSKRNCTINSFQEKGESLENYYLNLIGGADNE